MAQISRQPTHTCEVVTQQGEVKILLEINLNINGLQAGIVPVTVAEEDEKVQWAIPSFKSDNKIKFGKKVEE